MSNTSNVVLKWNINDKTPKKAKMMNAWQDQGKDQIIHCMICQLSCSFDRNVANFYTLNAKQVIRNRKVKHWTFSDKSRVRIVEDRVGAGWHLARCNLQPSHDRITFLENTNIFGTCPFCAAKWRTFLSHFDKKTSLFCRKSGCGSLVELKMHTALIAVSINDIFWTRNRSILVQYAKIPNKNEHCSLVALL